MPVPDVIMIGEVIFIGVVACIIFDIWQRLFWLMTGIPATNWSMVGRWFGGVISKGQLMAKGLAAQPEYPRETAIGWAVHYAVAIAYAFIFAGLVQAGVLQASITDGLLFGVISVVVPWFFFMPALGNGILARLTPKPLMACSLALMMHSLFGLAMGAGFALLAG